MRNYQLQAARSAFKITIQQILVYVLLSFIYELIITIPISVKFVSVDRDARKPGIGSAPLTFYCTAPNFMCGHLLGQEHITIVLMRSCLEHGFYHVPL